MAVERVDKESGPGMPGLDKVEQIVIASISFKFCLVLRNIRVRVHLRLGPETCSTNFNTGKILDIQTGGGEARNNSGIKD